MLARVATFDGGAADGVRAALEAMTPPKGAGTRSPVDIYEVGVDGRM